MKVSETIGIDVSKLVIDVRIFSNQKHRQFENSNSGFRKMSNWVYSNNLFNKEEILFVFEHTGLYSYNLAVYLAEQNIRFTMVSGLEIKRSLGITRGKDDKIDATKIARYAYRLRDELQSYTLPSQELRSLKRLLSLRDRLVKQRAGYKTSLKEQKRVLARNGNLTLFEIQERVIKYLTKQIDKLEQEIDDLIASSDDLKKLYNLIISVKSIGPQTALFLIVYTAGFTKFRDSRKFASYCGIAPFPNTSGSSIKGKTRVSHLANKKIKSLLDQCAKNAIMHNYEMKVYYRMRIKKGKQKMSTINIIRNKLLARVFAVVQRETPYVELLKYAA